MTSARIDDSSSESGKESRTSSSQERYLAQQNKRKISILQAVQKQMMIDGKEKPLGL